MIVGNLTKIISLFTFAVVLRESAQVDLPEAFLKLTNSIQNDMLSQINVNFVPLDRDNDADSFELCKSLLIFNFFFSEKNCAPWMRIEFSRVLKCEF